MNISDNRPGFKVVQGDILQDKADIVVCPVNCVGIMVAGLAEQFAGKYPGLERNYRYQLANSYLRIGHPVISSTVTMCYPHEAVLIFPTKEHWDNDSRLEWIFRGLGNLYPVLSSFRPNREEVSIAMPALGCGLGHLEWEAVATLIPSIWAMGLPDRYSVRLYHAHRS